SYLEGKANRLESLSEKKMRALMKASSNKLRLIRERSKLIQEMDTLFLAIESEKTKATKILKLEQRIKEKEREIEKANIDVKIADNKFYDSNEVKKVVLWQGGKTLYKHDETTNLAYSLQKAGISAIVSGSLKDVSGYLVLKVRFETGLKGVPQHDFTEAGRYSDVENMVKKIATQIYTVIQNTREIKVFFDVQPKNAKVYIDSNIIEDFSKPITLREGQYTVEASADEYSTSTKTIVLADKNYYKLKINLKKENTALLAFNIEGKPELFFKTRYYGTSPTQLKLPYQSTVVEFEKDNVHTYVLLDKDKIPINEAAQGMVVRLNQKETKKLVERQRKIMYWSLGALYTILPAYLILNGIYSDKALAFNDGRLAQTQENAQNIKNLNVVNITLQSLAIVAGINYFIQLIVYLVFSDRAIPRQPKIVNIDEAKHDITELPEEPIIDKNDEAKPKE
ncbi:MAG: PEGA domain-containing protein, partial [Treponema sp.]